MPSPFPGMNPFIESAVGWRDFHTRYVVALADDLGALVQPRYVVRVEDNVFLREPSAAERRVILGPDIAVAGQRPRPAPGIAAAVADAPAWGYAPVAVEEETVPYLEIRDRASWAVVCVLEVLSPSNKNPGDDRGAHWDKVKRVMRSDAAYVEIDLLRGGPRLPWDGLPACDYYAVVSRPAARPKVGIWPVGLRDPLPGIPIPLRAGEGEPLLPLAPALHRTYDSAGYGHYIYGRDPAPPLAPADAAWAAEILASAGIARGAV